MVYKRNGRKPPKRNNQKGSEVLIKNKPGPVVYFNNKLTKYELQQKLNDPDLSEAKKDDAIIAYETQLEMQRQNTWLQNLAEFKGKQKFSRQWLLFNIEELLLQCMGKRKVILGTAGKEKAQYVFKSNTAKQLLELTAKLLGELKDHAPGNIFENNRTVFNINLSELSQDDIKQLDYLADQEQSNSQEVILTA